MQTELISATVMVLIYRSLTVLCGLGVVFLGYRLFRVGVYEKAGELKASWGEKNLLLKQAAPGTFFALFGAVIITVSIWKGIEIKSTSSGHAELETPTQSSATKSPETRRGLILSNAFAALGQKSSLPTEVGKAIQKVIQGEKLSPKEVKSVQGWLETQESFSIIGHSGGKNPIDNGSL